MKFNKVKDFNILEEGLSGSSKLSGLVKVINKIVADGDDPEKRFMRNILSNPSSSKGKKEFTEYSKEIQNKYGIDFTTTVNGDTYVWHHIDGNHSNDAITNLAYLPSKVHNSINGKAINRLYSWINNELKGNYDDAIEAVNYFERARYYIDFFNHKMGHNIRFDITDDSGKSYSDLNTVIAKLIQKDNAVNLVESMLKQYTSFLGEVWNEIWNNGKAQVFKYSSNGKNEWVSNQDDVGN